MSEPTSDEQISAAVIEVVERHSGAKKPTVGYDSVLLPNHVRINGMAVIGQLDEPVVVHEIVFDGAVQSPFTVTVSLLARALRIGQAPAGGDPEQGDALHGAVVEIPDVDVDALVGGDVLARPYVLLNGHRLWLGTGGIGIGPMTSAGSGSSDAVVRVALPLLCRRLVVDDEPES